jgi:hypothetical protein
MIEYESVLLSPATIEILRSLRNVVHYTDKPTFNEIIQAMASDYHILAESDVGLIWNGYVYEMVNIKEDDEKMTLCETITKLIIRMVDEGKNLDEIANEMCPSIEYGREKIIRIIKDFLGEEYLIQHAETLKYDVGKAELAKKRKHQSHEIIDATTDAVVESASAAPIASCQTTVQAVNTEHVKEAQAKEAGQTKGQEQEHEQVIEHDKHDSCCQSSSKAVRKKRDSESDSEKETTGQEPNDEPVENRFDVLVEALKKLIKLFNLDTVKKALTVAESNV